MEALNLGTLVYVLKVDSHMVNAGSEVPTKYT
jgi:hypothetical protein